MTFKTIRKIKGHEYLYEIKGYRENGKVKQINKCLGRVDKINTTKDNTTINTTINTTNEPDQNIDNDHCSIKSHIEFNEINDNIPKNVKNSLKGFLNKNPNMWIKIMIGIKNKPITKIIEIE